MLVYLNTLTCKKHAILTTELPKKNPQARSCKEKHVKLFSKIYVSWTSFCFWSWNFLFHYYSNWTKFLCCNFKWKLHIQVYWNNVPRLQFFSFIYDKQKWFHFRLKSFQLRFCSVLCFGRNWNLFVSFATKFCWFETTKNKVPLFCFSLLCLVCQHWKEHDRNKTIENR